jgi:CheY-like chemotaxis protein
MQKDVDTADAHRAPGMQPHPIDWAQRFHAVTQTAVQAQLVHRGFRPLWVNAAFADLFRFASVAEVLSCACLLDLFDPGACADARDWPRRCGGPMYGRRLLCRRGGARFPADLYSRLVVWDGADAASICIVDASHEEATLSQLATSAPDDWRCPSVRPTWNAEQRWVAGHPLQVLLVEADPARRQAAATLLLSLGCRPRCAKSAAQALAALHARAFDLVVLALDLPIMDGFELSRRIRTLPTPSAGLPIAALAPRADADMREAVADAGMDACLLAPLTRRRLAETVTALTRSIEPAELDEIEQEHERDEPGDRVDCDHGFSAWI